MQLSKNTPFAKTNIGVKTSCDPRGASYCFTVKVLFKLNYVLRRDSCIS